jgi:hypothetical protein
VTQTLDVAVPAATTASPRDNGDRDRSSRANDDGGGDRRREAGESTPVNSAPAPAIPAPVPPTIGSLHKTAGSAGHTGNESHLNPLSKHDEGDAISGGTLQLSPSSGNNHHGKHGNGQANGHDNGHGSGKGKSGKK